MAEQQAPQPGSLFGVPKFSTQRRLVDDNGNGQLGFTPKAASQTNIATTRLDQLDIVTGLKLYTNIPSQWTFTGAPQASFSPFFPSNIIQGITCKFQAAYNSYNLTGPLAQLIQGYRPMWGSRDRSSTNDAFAQPTSTARPTTATPVTYKFGIDIPLAPKFDEYFDLSAQGDPLRKVYDAIVSPLYMAAQARVVVPTITIAPQLGATDLLGSPAAGTGGSYLSTATATMNVKRDAFWTANNVAANPPQYPWMYTRDYFTQPTSGQAKVGVLIQNTGVAVGQVLSLFGFVWDPLAVSPGGQSFGNVVPLTTAIASIELVTGGSLQNIFHTPDSLRDKMRSLYGGQFLTSQPDGTFVLDFALSEDGGYISNAEAINTYLVNGVQLNITFNQGFVPSAQSTVYMGVEALKLVTS